MRGILVAVLGMACVTGCFDGSNLAASEVCNAYCDCLTVIGTQQQECVDACEEQLAGDTIPEACVTCAREAACTEIEPCLDSCFATEAP